MNGRIIPRLERGYLVKNPKKDEWGDGVILSVIDKSSRDNATALQILKSIVDGIPYNESRNEYEPITPKWRKFLD